MLIPENNQSDLQILKTDLDYADSDKKAQKIALNIKNQIKGFHINGDAKQGLINIYNKFTDFGNQLQGDNGINALQLMIIKLVDCYINDYLVLGHSDDFKPLSEMWLANNDYYKNPLESVFNMNKAILIVKKIAHNDAVIFYNDLNQVSAEIDLVKDKVAVLKDLDILLSLKNIKKPKQSNLYVHISKINLKTSVYNRPNNTNVLLTVDKLIKTLK